MYVHILVLVLKLFWVGVSGASYQPLTRLVHCWLLPTGGFLPPPPDETVVQALTSLGEPTLASLGLCNYTPPGLIQKLLETLHVSAELPWLGSIIARK